MFQIILIGIVAIVVIFLIETIVLLCKKNVETRRASYDLLVSALIPTVITCAICALFFNEVNRVPVVVETACQPQIDTTIFICDGVADTTYTYTFPNIIVE